MERTCLLLSLCLFFLVRFCVSDWAQPVGLCVTNASIQAAAGVLATNEGLPQYSNNMTCRWEISAPEGSETIYVMVSGSSGADSDFLVVNGEMYAEADGDFGVYSSPLVVEFTSGINGTGAGFRVYWQTLVDTPDRLQLIQFYLASNGAHWYHGWDFRAHHCEFYGVRCTLNFTVESLILHNNNLVGFIPQDFNLPSLRTLDLSFNSLKGKIAVGLLEDPPTLCNLNSNFFCGSEFPPSCFNGQYDMCANVKPTIKPTTLNSSHYNLSTSQSSPYAMVLSPRTAANLALEAVYTKVVISGVIADIKMVQVYKNNGNDSIDVDYYFPSSPTAVVYAMQFVKGGNLVIAQIQTTLMAELTFDEAVSQGLTGALLGSSEGSILTLKIANIPPHTLLRVEIFYTEQLIPDEGTYQFYYPSIIPPQYLDEMEGVDQDPSQFNCLFIMEIILQLPFTLSHISCPTHSINISTNNNTAGTQFSSIGLISDFLLEYSMLGNEILAGTLLYEIEKNRDNFYNGNPLQNVVIESNFFMSIVQSPKIEFTSEFIVKREYIFVLDTSTSMTGRPEIIARQLINNLLSLLKPDEDLFNIITFSGDLMIYKENSVLATSLNLSDALLFVRQTTFSGHSNLLPALKKATSIPKRWNYSRIITIITDGLISVQKSVLLYIQNNTQNANFYSVAIGTVPNRYLTQGIATIGGGKEFWIQHPSNVKDISEKFIRHVLYPVLTNITLDFNPDFNVNQSTLSSLSDVMVDKPLLISGQYKGTIPDGKLFTIQGVTSHGISWRKDVFPTRLTTNSPQSLIYLWAGSKIRELEFTSDNEEDITDISTKYHVLSKYTSFVATETQINFPPENLIDVFSPLSTELSKDKCMKDCPKPDCSGKCYPSFDGSSDYCPLSQCSTNEYCSDGICVFGNSSTDCNCFGVCSPYTCNGVMCPPYCDFGNCLGGLCSTISPGGCLCAPIECELNICFPFDNIIFPSTVIPQNCSTQECPSSSVCDTDISICVSVVNQDTTIDCEGELSGNNTNFICNNGNFIYLSSSNFLTSNFFLDGILAVEGDIVFSYPVQIIMTINSFIAASHYVAIHPESTIVIDFMNTSYDNMQTLFINEPDGTISIQIIKSQVFVSDLSTLTVIVINSPNSTCFGLKNRTGLLLSLSDCRTKGVVDLSLSIMGIVLGTLSLAVVLGGVASYFTYKRKRDSLNDLNVDIN